MAASQMRKLRHLFGKLRRGAQFNVLKFSKRSFWVRQDLRFWVDPLFFFVEAKRVKIFWLQPRRGFYPTPEGFGTLATIIRMTFADEFGDFDLELLDLKVPPGEKERVPSVLGFSTLPQLTDDEVRGALSRFALAFDAIRQMGVQRRERRPRNPDIRPGPDLFD